MRESFALHPHSLSRRVAVASALTSPFGHVPQPAQAGQRVPLSAVGEGQS